MVSHGIVPNVKRDVALIGTAEKGYATFELTVEMPGGHSSKPPAETSLDVLMSAAEKIHRHAFEKRAVQSIDEFMDYVGPEMPGMFKTIFANQWLFKSVILSQYAQTKEGNAMVRTTGVTTVMNAGMKENVIPSKVSAKVNFRILPGETVKEVELEIEKIIDDKRVEIKPVEIFEPSKTTAAGTWGFQLLQKTSSEVFPDAIVAPFLMIGSTDSKHFEDISDNIYRFFPTRMDSEALSGFHGINEKIKIPAYMETIAFYKQLITDMQWVKDKSQPAD
jgi:carboxypeptidase PM20D1